MPDWMASNSMWSQIFAVGAPVAEKILRPVIVYVFLVALLRVFGKRELAQLNPFDLVVLLSLSNTVQNAIIGNDNSLTGGLIGAFKTVSTDWYNQQRGTPGAPLWQRDFYDHIIRNEDELEKIREYIRTNPLMWRSDPDYS